MPRRLSILASLALCLSACAQAPGMPATTTVAEARMHTDAAPTPPPQAKAAITGAIREGNRPPPALRVCAHSLDGGNQACIDTAAGASVYRIEVEAGRYVIAGRAKDDPGMAFAYAERIRCIRAPCPPDVALVIEVAAGETRSGIDLTLGEALPPAEARD